MICRELHAYLEESWPLDFDSWGAPAEIAEHILDCANCGRFVEAKKELARNLALVREAAPQFPPSLNATVLASYRRYTAATSRDAGSTSVAERLRFVPLVWTAAAATAVLAMILFFPSGRGTGPAISQPRGAASASALQSPGHEVAAALPVVSQKRPHLGLRDKRTVAAKSAGGDALPTQFQSLMYCDELSCGGTLAMIRVQLPSSVAAFTPDAASTNGVVLADVLVGPDGIARGIRIVE